MRTEYQKGRSLLERSGAIEVVTTHTLWGLVDDEEILVPFKGDGSNIKNAILFERSDDNEDGTYPRVSDYIRCVNSIEEEGTSYYLNRYRRKKERLDIQWDGVRIIRDSEYTCEAELIFDNPIEVVFGKVGEQRITKHVKRIKGEFTHDWFWTRNGRQDKVANGFEIWFNIKEYLE